MPRRCTTNSSGDEIQIGMLQCSAARERSGGHALCEGQARAIQTRRMQQCGCWLRKWRMAPHVDPPPDAVHRQDRWCSREGEAPGCDSSSARHGRCSRSRRAELDRGVDVVVPMSQRTRTKSEREAWRCRYRKVRPT